MKFLTLGFLFLFSNNIFAEDNMKLILNTDESDLILYLLNDTTDSVLVNKRLSIGPESGPNEIMFHIHRVDGKVFPFSAKIRLGPPSDDSFTMLEKSELIGRAFQINQLAKYYALNSGSYQIKAVYKNRYGIDKSVFGDELESNSLMLKVE